ncbi:MAG: hypothetical protein RL693_2001 [Verrucomicrobiota bacterium]|jgi:hypothetical protein
MHLSLRQPIARRHFLKAGAVSLALPALNAMLPRGLRAAEPASPKRLLLIARNLGLHAPFFFPETPGLGYESTRYLRHLEEHLGKFTTFSGVSHLRYSAHMSEPGLFTGVDWDHIKEPGKGIRNSISLDQFAAERIGGDTRYRNLVIGLPTARDFSWTEKGVPVPVERSHLAVFRQLFTDCGSDEVANEMHRLKTGRSILDKVNAQAKALGRTLGSEDRERIELMFSSVREAEQGLVRSEAWLNKPKPHVDYATPKADPNPSLINDRETLWFDLIRLAFQTDSTRVIMLTVGEAGRADIDGLNLAHHDASHHGKDETKVEQLALIEETELKLFSRFLGTMQQVREGDATLFDHTAILNATNLGNASAHTCENLPVILAGGGFKHQGHVIKDRKDNTPLSNLYVRMLHQIGIEAPSFGSSSGILSEI